MSPRHSRWAGLGALLLVAGCIRPVEKKTVYEMVETPVEAAKPAPWELGTLSHARVLYSPENSAGDAAMVLILSASELSCSTLAAYVGDSVDPFREPMADARGLQFVLYRRDFAGGLPAGPEAFVGLWSGNGETPSAFAYLGGMVLYDGWGHQLGSAPLLQVDVANSVGMDGSYTTEWWSGTFTASSCGSWTEPERDSG